MLESDRGGPGSLITGKGQDYEHDDSIVLEKEGLHSSLLPKVGIRSWRSQNDAHTRQSDIPGD